MRTPTRIRKALIGVVCAPALNTGAQALTATKATPPTTPPTAGPR
jgi:hypothetical protein